MTTTNANTIIKSVSTHEPTQFDFQKFIEHISSHEGCERRAFSFMADLNTFFYFEELMLAQRDLAESNITNFVDTHRDEVLSYKPESLKKISDVYLLKAIRGITSLNSYCKEKTGTTFMRKLKKDEDGWIYRDCRNFFELFEDEFNNHYNPRHISENDFRNIRWDKKIK